MRYPRPTKKRRWGSDDTTLKNAKKRRRARFSKSFKSLATKTKKAKKRRNRRPPPPPPPPREDEEEDDEEDSGDGADTDSSVFDCHIREISTRKSDIDQCHAAQHKLVPKHPFRFMLSGASGSGKTTVLLNLLKRFYINNDKSSYFDEIYAIGPTVKFDDMWKELDLDDDHLIEKPTIEVLEQIYKEAEEEVKQKGIDRSTKILIVFEDIISHAKFMRSTEFLKAYVMGRHFGISVMVCTQSFTKVPRACRLQCTQIAFFPSSQSEMKLMNEEYCPPHTSRREFFDVMHYATTPDAEDEYPFLYIDHPAKPEDRFRKTFGRKIRIPSQSSIEPHNSNNNGFDSFEGG